MKRSKSPRKSESYRHPEAEALLRPDVGTQPQFRKQKPAAVYRYDASLSPSLDWAGKAERLSFEVPTLPLFVHERLSTAAILETLKGHRRDEAPTQFDLFGESDLPLRDRLLKAYEHRNGWVNRLILGDSLVVMNSLLGFEGLGGQVQTIYLDPPYAVKFGSNFQPFVRRREVRHNADDDMSREPEMVQAYRDTWELGIHSFLTYLRDRLLLARELLHPPGASSCRCPTPTCITCASCWTRCSAPSASYRRSASRPRRGSRPKTLATLGDYLLWYARDPERLKVRKLFDEQPAVPGEGNARWVLLPDGNYRGVSAAERRREAPLPEGARLYNPDNLQSQGAAREPQPFEFQGRVYQPGANSHWKPNYPAGLNRLAAAGRLHVAANSIRYRRFATDFPFRERGNLWTDTLTGSFTEEKRYVVQTNPKVIERCLHLTSDPGDLVLDPTCGSGTTAWCAEKWGRRWITIDTSRVPLAIARQRLLTARLEYFRLREPERGPAGGFVYARRQNAKGEEIGGIVPHVTLESIANDEPPREEVMVDRPERDANVTRVSGPFCVEATIPTPADWEGEVRQPPAAAPDDGYADHVERMIDVLRRSPVLRLGGGRSVTFSGVRRPARTMSLSAEAKLDKDDEGPVAIVFGPENGAVSQTLVFESAREANVKGYGHLYVIGFAIQPDARSLIEISERALGVPATYVQASPDLTMGDLLKNMRSSQVFSVCGLPDVRIERTEDRTYRVHLLGLDVFDPTTMDTDHRAGADVPAWFLDTDYNGLCFHVCQAFFPRTSAWEGLKHALRGDFAPSVWQHLAGTSSAPFAPGDLGQIAVKVIDDRGNELLVVKPLAAADQ